MFFEIVKFYHRRKKTFISIATIMILAIVVVTLSICIKRYNYPQELVEIDSICNVAPSKAKEMLSAYKAERRKMNEEAKCFFRLLTLKSTIKSDNKIYDDCEAKALVKHFKNNGDRNLLPEVYYCAGCAYNSLMDIPQANKCFFYGIKSIPENKDKNLLALFCYQLGQNFSAQNLHKEAYYWESKSLAINKERKDTTRCIYDYMNIAWTFGNLGHPHQALKVMLKAKRLAEAAKNKSILSEIDCQITNHYLELGILNEAKKHIEYAIKEKSSDRSELYSIALETYTKLGEDDKINEYSDSIMRHGNVYGKRYAYWCLLNQGIKDKKLSDISKYVKYYKIFDDSVKKISAEEASAKAHALYNYKLHERENIQLQKENADKNLYIIIFSASFIISLLSAYIIYFKLRQQKKLTEKRCKILTEQLKKNKEINTDYISKKEQEIKELKELLETNKLEDTKNALNIRQTELEELNSRKKRIRDCSVKIKGTEVYKQIRCILNGYDKNTFTEWKELEKAIYNSFPDFETKLHNLVDLKYTELKVCLLTRMGLSVKEISIITCASPSSIYSINQRLYYKNFGKYAASSDWIEFINTIY